jgi:hypothetical protein
MPPVLIFLGIGVLALILGSSGEPTADRPKRAVPKRRKRGSVSASGGEPESPVSGGHEGEQSDKPEPSVPQGEPTPATPEGPKPETSAAVG